MSIYRDSVGGSYSRLPSKPPNHTAKSTTTKMGKKRRDKGGRNERRYAEYRKRAGKPNGPGQPGNKSGANKR